MEETSRAIRRPRLYAITGLKVVAVIGVFLWHALPKEHLIDLGARGCELMFVASGFLVAYNRHEWFSTRIGDAFRYLVSKVRKVYPLYLFSLGVALVVLTAEGTLLWDVPRTYLTLPFHLTMTQTWSHLTALGFNTPAWFLSSLMVCYAAAPLLSQAVKRAVGRWGLTRGLLLVFTVLLLCRGYLGACHGIDPGLFTFSLHTNPIVRFLEFGMAYVAGVAYVSGALPGKDIADAAGDEAKTSARLRAGVAEVFFCALFALCALFLDEALPRLAYVLLALPVVYTLAIERGPVSAVLASGPLQIASTMEMQFYLLHWDVIHACALAFGVAPPVLDVPQALVAFVASVGVSLLARRMFPAVRPT